MSTRIGIRREGKVLAASERVNADDSGRQYYDLLINITSYAARNQYGITSSERVQQKEWDRYFLTTIGIQGDRLFELRLQVKQAVFPVCSPLRSSFRRRVFPFFKPRVQIREMPRKMATDPISLRYVACSVCGGGLREGPGHFAHDLAQLRPQGQLGLSRSPKGAQGEKEV